MIGVVLGVALLVSGLGVFALMRFVKLEAQQRVLRLVGWFDIAAGIVAIGLGLSGRLS